jgi:hypothetical protein
MFTQIGDIADSIVGIYNFYDVNGSITDDMAFYYPSYRESNYSTLSYQIDQNIYQNLISNQQTTNNSYILLSNSSRTALSPNIFTLCKLRTGSNAIFGFTCLDFDVNRFNTLALMTIGYSNLINANYYLIAPAISGSNNATIINNITTSNQSYVNTDLEQSIINDLLPSTSLTSKTRALNRFTYLLILQTSIKTYYLFSFLLWEDLNQANSIVAYYLA